VTVVADSHAVFWYLRRSPNLSAAAGEALGDAERIVVSVATLVDLWYVTQTTGAITADELARVRAALEQSPRVDVHAIDGRVAGAYTDISRAALSDPWDRFIVATARVVEAPLVTRDEAIQTSGLVETIW
jgi:PIN domain nuclease of toxin-antitoxin system